jgi:hypothetical protein
MRNAVWLFLRREGLRFKKTLFALDQLARNHPTQRMQQLLRKRIRFHLNVKRSFDFAQGRRAHDDRHPNTDQRSLQPSSHPLFADSQAVDIPLS